MSVEVKKVTKRPYIGSGPGRTVFVVYHNGTEVAGFDNRREALDRAAKLRKNITKDRVVGSKTKGREWL